MSLKKNVSEIHPPVAGPLEVGGKVKGPQDKISVHSIQVFKVLSLLKFTNTSLPGHQFANKLG